jgi:hypothetical protein
LSAYQSPEKQTTTIANTQEVLVSADSIVNDTVLSQVQDPMVSLQMLVQQKMLPSLLGMSYNPANQLMDCQKILF